MAVFEGVPELAAAVGRDLGTTGWHAIEQRRVDAFADLTGDHGWIHVDEERARAQSPFGGTIAHGALTLALCVTFLCDLVQVRGIRLMVNAGVERARLRAPVRVGSRVRGRARVLAVRTLTDFVRAVVEITVEIEGEPRAACVVQQVVALYP
jgi:acyl dehydratase